MGGEWWGEGVGGTVGFSTNFNKILLLKHHNHYNMGREAEYYCLRTSLLEKQDSCEVGWVLVGT
jgi:hypothetical protein